MYYFYDLLFSLLFLIYSPVFLFKMFKGKYREGILHRFGYLPSRIVAKFHNKKTIWVHAVSVGETVAASAIVARLKKEFPEHKILFSTVTDTGQEMARKIITEADGFIYFPLDLSKICKRVIRAIKPELVVITETELWPNFIRVARDNGAKVMLANGRVSDNSFKGYKLLGSLLQDMLNRLDILAMQSEEDAQKIVKLGAPAAKVVYTGNTKFDQTYAAVDDFKKAEIRKEFNIDRNQPVLVVGSTHPGEEELIIELYQSLRENYPELKLILAPRHIERTEELENLFAKVEIATIRRSKIEKDTRVIQSVILLDTIGELAQVYSIADLAFVGGSLVDFGGHNILEPAAHGKLVFFGPYMSDFKDSVELVLKNKVGIQVSDDKELLEKMEYFLKNKEELRLLGEKALEIIQANRGATKKNTDLAKELVNNR